MKRGGKKPNGLFNIDFDTGVNEDIDENDSDLEAELLALAGDNAPKRPQRKKPPPQTNLDSMIAESMKDIPSDDDISVDENDPDLLSELNDIVGGDEVEGSSPIDSEPPSTASVPSANMELLEKRLEMYEEAEKHAKETGETSKARRYARGKSSVKDLIKQAKSGKPINIDDIPPEVKIPKERPTENKVTAEEPNLMEIEQEQPTSQPISPNKIEPDSGEMKSESAPLDVDEDLLALLKQRHMQYKMAALKAKKSNNVQGAVNYLKTAKQFEHVIEAVQNGQAVDISQMPGPPEMESPKIEEEKMQQSSEVEEDAPKETTPAPPASLGEALLQCVDFYKKQEEKAKAEENASKARRIGRIIKQFEQAIKQNKAGKPVAVDELPVPPGFPPLQGPKPVAAPKPASPEASGSSSEASPVQVTKPEPPKHTTTRNTGNQVPNSRADQQMQVLLLRQKQFKEAALKAKKKGEITQAKEFLRTAKGFDKLIEATSCGLPVDFSTLPLPPDEKSQLDKEFDMVSADDCLDDDPSSTDILTRLEHQLQKQLKMCLTTRDHNKALGDVAGTNRFERLALNVTKDLDLVRLAKKTPGAGIPKFHYENKDFSVVKSFTELTDNELEISILRGINYNAENPKEIDTYVKFSFPWPQETPFTEKTATIKDTNNPEYNATFMVPINRTQRSCQRMFKRHAAKFEVYSKGGWFRSDTLLGSVTVKLQNLETQCELHDSYDLMDGRKKAGGKLEIRMRLRHPIVTQEVERLHEKWLVIGS
ncbi:coiled-coil and C2 domain-containing protein 1-like isoform X2 [Coccinella septempunctata]|uniref:coiled-coil and C2 domain-containing protein 1-like isoform X2 n=1 Tax=Coccinella septempunctata TaxID=41139 RepID=UPI001D08D931|nr:coiled-coil and C2 domain-containing protein 1-like isoform X2 [Coccinella septempunctata]